MTTVHPKSPSVGEAGSTPGRLDVLVVDDDADTCEAVAEALTDAGYVARCVGDGVQALKLLRNGPTPKVILLDLMMPRMSGWILFKEIRDLPALKDVPVILMTGHGPQWGYPVPRVLRKPVGYNELVLTLRNAIERI
jgi:DNA-binding NtrC family response regulator